MGSRGRGVGDRAGQGPAGGHEVDRGLGVDAAVAVDVVRVAVLVATARVVEDVEGGRADRVGGRGHEVAAQGGLRGQHQGERAGDVGGGHGRAAEGLVAATGDGRLTTSTPGAATSGLTLP